MASEILYLNKGFSKKTNFAYNFELWKKLIVQKIKYVDELLSHISRPGCFSMNLMTACLKAEIYRSKLKFNAN